MQLASAILIDIVILAAALGIIALTYNLRQKKNNEDSIAVIIVLLLLIVSGVIVVWYFSIGNPYQNVKPGEYPLATIENGGLVTNGYFVIDTSSEKLKEQILFIKIDPQLIEYQKGDTPKLVIKKAGYVRRVIVYLPEIPRQTETDTQNQ